MKRFLLILLFSSTVFGSVYMGSPTPVFTRNSVAYNSGTALVAANVPRTETVVTASTPAIYIDLTNVRVPKAAMGDTILTVNGANLYKSTVAEWGDGSSPTYNLIPDTGITKGISAIKMLDEQTWILSVTDYTEGEGAHIWRTADGGATFDDVFTGENGFVPYWDSFDVLGDMVIAGEYDTFYNGAGRVYLSTNRGATWAKIYTPLPDVAMYRHLHVARFASPTVIYLSYGDMSNTDPSVDATKGDNGKIVKLTLTEGTWVATTVRQYASNPTCMIVNGGYVYLTKDGGFEALINRFAVGTTTIEDLWDTPTKVSNDLSSPYNVHSNVVNSFALTKIDDIYYAAFEGLAVGTTYPMSMIVVSQDGVNWQCVSRKYSATGTGIFGYKNIVGEAGGYIWFGYKAADGTDHTGRMDKVQVKNVTAYSVERGVTNALTAGSSSLESTSEFTSYYRKNSTLTGRKVASTIGATAKEGSYVWRVKGTTDASADTSIMTEIKPGTPIQPTLNQYVCASFWVKAMPGHNRLFSIKVYLLTTGTGNGAISSNWSYITPSDTWRKVTVWGKCTTAFDGTKGLLVTAYVFPKGAFPAGTSYVMSTDDWGNCDFIMDAASIYVSDTIHYSGDWQIGGTARADEYASIPLSDVGSAWSTSFTWYPAFGSTELHADLPIATIKGVDDSTIYLFYDQSEGKFALLDNGTQTAFSEVVTWEPADYLKFAITSDGTDSTLWIQSSKDALDDTAATAVNLTGYPTTLYLSQNPAQDSFGLGSFAQIRKYSGVLSSPAETFNQINNPTIHNITADTYHSTIQAAIDTALEGDEIVVYPGTYTGDGNRDIDFKGKAITLRSTVPEDANVVEATIIDCQGLETELHRGFIFQSGEGQNSVLSGLTVTNGFSNNGGGIYCADSSPVISYCSIIGNIAKKQPQYDGHGGGIYLLRSNAFIKFCKISDNFCVEGWINEYNFTGDGGGIYCNSGNPIISHTELSNNTVGSEYGGGGGGIAGFNSSMKISDCIISGNRGNYFAGGIRCDSDSIISNSIIRNNYAYEGDGGGVFCYDNVIIENCLIEGNRATYWGGGGVACSGSPRITKCKIIGNDTVGQGGGVWGGSPTIEFCDIIANTANSWSGGGISDCDGLISNCNIIANLGYGITDCNGTIKNCIIWDNDFYHNDSPQIILSSTPSYSCIKNWNGGGAGNISIDPCFVSGGYVLEYPSGEPYWVIGGDYHLKSVYGRWDSAKQKWVYDDTTSPCIDAGDPNSDWTEEFWPHGRRINMGVYGGTHQASMSASEIGNPADLNNDSTVEMTDFALQAGQWHLGQLRTIPKGDLTVDGDLGDWTGHVEWIPLDKIYYGEPNDVREAKFALRWNEQTDKIYLAVIVDDNDHVFTNDYLTWDAGDRIEVYTQGDAQGGSGFWHWENPTWDSAQQYMVAHNTSSYRWATWGNGWPLGGDVNLEYATVVEGGKVIYEVGVQQFDNYGGLSGGETIETELGIGHIVGFDVIVDTRWSGGFGMLSENLMVNKFKNADRFERYILSDKPILPADTPLVGDIDRNAVVDIWDFNILANNWLAED